MVGIVLVSHSKALALAVKELVLQMVGPEFPIAVAAGMGDDFSEIGTDAVHVSEILKPFCEKDGALVLMDLGSAVLSAQTALELLEYEDIPDYQEKIRICSGPFVEAAVAASVVANTGADLDTVAREAMASLGGKADQVGDVVVEPEADTLVMSAADDVLTFDSDILNPHGLHARPAANLIQAVCRFASEVQLSNVTTNRGPVSARSMTGVARLQARKGDCVRFHIAGVDAQAAYQALQDLARARFGEAEGAAETQVSAVEHPILSSKKGVVPVSDGVAIGPVVNLDAARPMIPDQPSEGVDREKVKLTHALARVRDDIRDHAKDDPQGIFAAQALILDDPELLSVVTRCIESGASARVGWRQETENVAAAYSEISDAYLQARAADVRDIARRVDRVLAGAREEERIAPETPSIIMVDELLPSEASACDPKKVLGILARSGSGTAHAAIITRTLGIPMVIAGEGLDEIAQSATVVAFDGLTGELVINPEPGVEKGFLTRQKMLIEQRASYAAMKDQPAVTLDGEAIEVLANVGGDVDATVAKDNGAEGVGLLRSEFVYLPFTEIPSEDQQVTLLRSVFEKTGAGPIVIRTLDVGADKPVGFLEQAKEANPFLGVRGIRLSFANPDFFTSNLRAILRAAISHDVWLMFPMIATPEEMIRARGYLTAAHEALELESIEHAWPVSIGMMVEVPAAVVTLEQFVPHADFFSIGTNDLTQYVMAAERGNAGLASLQDVMHPAMLRMIQQTCEKAGDRHVSVCGDAASDPVIAKALLAAGVRSLSVRSNQVAEIKAMARTISVTDMKVLFSRALDECSATAVRNLFASQ